MRISSATIYVASLVAALVVVTISLHQPPSGFADGIYARRDLPSYQPPKGCFGIGAEDYQHDNPKLARQYQRLMLAP